LKEVRDPVPPDGGVVRGGAESHGRDSVVNLRRMRALWRRCGLLLIAGLAVATAVRALDEMTLDLERVEGAGWAAEGLQASFGLQSELPSVRASIARLKLVGAGRELENVRIDCPAVEMTGDVISCPRARIEALAPGLGRQRMTARVRYGRGDGSLEFSLSGLRFGEGSAAIDAALRSGQWSLKADVRDASMDAILGLARDLKVPLPARTATGTVSFTLDAAGAGSSMRTARFDVRARQLTANNESGSLASDQLSFDARGSVETRSDGLRYSVTVRSDRGQAYAQPIFVDFGAHALSASMQGTLRDAEHVTIDRFELDHAGVARASGRGVVDLTQEQPVRDLHLLLQALQFPGAYESYLQPLLLDTNFKSMQTAGAVSGEVDIVDGEPQRAAIDLRDLTLDDGAGQFAIAGLEGSLRWQGTRAGRPGGSDDDDSDLAGAGESSLRWSSGSVFGLALGDAQLRFVTEGQQFRLLEGARIPVLDGALELESFRIRNAGTPKVAFIIDATIHPISVRELCRAFGWPEFGGQIGGVVSKLRMREGIVTLGTTLKAQVFDGEVRISDLKLEQPFGTWPRMYSNIALNDLDLELVTGAFSFGRITGRLSGAIDGLQLFNWTPVAFDARLYTPANDRSRHRISQRAVENIGSIGGGGAGVTAALSSGFLRFFEDFNYDRLGLSCRLRNDVCTMEGVAPAPSGGYYLVKGKGVPRIDVIGNSRRVDWPRLVQQLIAVTESGGPVVK
jgi:hypothetical protein